MNRTRSALFTLVCALVFAGCGFEQQSTNLLAPSPSTSAPTPGPTTPAPSSSSLIGTWTSPALVAGTGPNACGSLRYQVTSHIGTSISGGLSGECANGLTISGNAAGDVNGTAITIHATGTGSMPTMPNCSFALAATGTIEDNGTALSLAYSGTSCLGPMSGAGVLKRQ